MPIWIFFFYRTDVKNEVLRSTFLDTTGAQVCTSGSDGRAIIWTKDQMTATEHDITAPSTSTQKAAQQKYTKALTLSHGDSQIYACETVPCVTSAHVMTAAESQLLLWDIAEGGRDI